MKASLTVVAVIVALPAIGLSCRKSSPGGPSAAAPQGLSGRVTGVTWSNEPAGLTTLTDHTWTTLVDGGWNRRPSAYDRIVTDAPPPPASALEYDFPEGFGGGFAPATHYFEVAGRRELFVGLEWKVSNPWQGHPSYVNKIQFIYTASSDIAMVMFGPNGGPFELRVMPQWPEHKTGWLTPNANGTAPALGSWQRVEWYLKYESSYGAGDGIVRWWLNGALVGDYKNVRYPRDSGFNEYQISPTWGGIGDVKRENDYYRFKQAYLSGR